MTTSDPKTSEAVDRIEATLHPEGRCSECGGGLPYWKHGDGEGQHPFKPIEPLTPQQESTLRAVLDANAPGWGWDTRSVLRSLLKTIDDLRADARCDFDCDACRPAEGE